MIKYNFGGGPKRVENFINVDALQWNGATDIVWDLTNVPYSFVKPETVEEIVAIELLEHISFRDTLKVLCEWCRILKVGGKLTIQVPDCGKMMKYYAEHKVCVCVPHKALDITEFKANPKCWNCGGKGIVNPDRWLFAFTGAQKHEFDTHKSIFTEEVLKKCLGLAGFSKVEFQEHIYKLIVVCTK